MRLAAALTLSLSLVTGCAKGQSHEQHGYPGPVSSTPKTSAVAPAINFPSSLAGEAQGYIAMPAGAGKKPALIVIPEWWGVNDWVRQQTDRFATQGYVALAVDLYRGHVASTPDEAHELMRALPEDRANADLKAAFDYLASRKDVDASHIGVIGWCMGGGYALALATNEPRLAASVINYGRLVTDPATIAKIHAPILGNFGAKDRGIPVEDVKAFDAALKKAGKESDIKIYDDAGHAFINPNNKEGYRAESAADAQQRIDRFLAAKLRAKIPNS
ncbi:MAG TPA: dienelactone hydrolase family protein [Thermoanaerobaculia bacterium]|nr:dienelactone hydrolase family protein [Thermoanaerobaculia bacterium]